MVSALNLALSVSGELASSKSVQGLSSRVSRLFSAIVSLTKEMRLASVLKSSSRLLMPGYIFAAAVRLSP